MNLFFDLECANCYNHVAKICEFGYVLTDDKLNIIAKENLIVNPMSPFNTYGFKMAGLTLAYEPNYYKKFPPLPHYFEKIKSLLTDSEINVFGYSTEYDAGYIASDFERNGLPHINFRFVDVLKLFREYLGRTEKLALDVLYSECAEQGELTHHEALNDALMTLECYKYFLKLSGLKHGKVITACPLAVGELYEGRVVGDGTIFHYTTNNRMTATNAGILKDFLKSINQKTRVENVAGKTFCFEKTYNKEHFAQVLYSAKLVSEGGGRLTNVSSRANVIVVERYGVKVVKNKRQRVIDLKTFLSYFGLTEADVLTDKIDVDYLISLIPANTEWYNSYLKNKLI